MADSVRLTQIEFFAGSMPDEEGLHIEPGNTVLLVGPNNSGKSLALREIEEWCRGRDAARKVIKGLTADLPGKEETMLALLRQVETAPPPGVMPAATNMLWVRPGILTQNQNAGHMSIDVSQLARLIQDGSDTPARTALISPFTTRLDGRTRFNLAMPQAAGNLQARPQNHLWALFVDDASRERVRNLTADAFGLYFTVDPTGMTQFRIRMSSRLPETPQEEQGLDVTARQFHGEATELIELGDGIQCYVGLVAAVLSTPQQIMLIDEPEAFLHPPLARRLGNNLSSIAHDRAATLIVATHSADFLMGCLEADSRAMVVRLTYESAKATARSVSPADLSWMMRDPFLRSVGMLRALFHRATVVTEGDSDRAFYDEMNRRLLEGNRGLRDAVFVNALNKDTVHRIVHPLRRLGIPAAAIVDLDVLEHRGKWRALLEACLVPEDKLVDLEAERQAIASYFKSEQTGKSRPITSQGLRALQDVALARAEALLEEVAIYGIFVVPNGELESWLPQYDISGHGNDWLIELLDKIGKDEENGVHLTPDSDDPLWRFLDSVAAWTNDPECAGM